MPACRKPNDKIIWLAVNGASLPYQRDEKLPEFGIVFKDKNNVPIEDSRGAECKASSKGVLDCKIKKNVKTNTYYDYSVVADSCHLDPRIYVP